MDGYASFNLQSQVKGYQMWVDQLAELEGKSILGDDFLTELRRWDGCHGNHRSFEPYDGRAAETGTKGIRRKEPDCRGTGST